ncbi:MAG: hypothetical protein IIZ25_02955 [Thermoguttaceae bacterium]|nr:hypothetical protein [Thermoguttaceae bacterium]
MSTCKMWCQMYEKKAQRGEPASVILEIAVKESDFKIKESYLWRVYGFHDSSKFDPKEFLQSIRSSTASWDMRISGARQTLKRGFTFDVPQEMFAEKHSGITNFSYLLPHDADVSISMGRPCPFRPRWDMCCSVRSWDTYDSLLIQSQSADGPGFLFKQNNNGRRYSLDVMPLLEELRPYARQSRGLFNLLVGPEGLVIRIWESELPRLIERIRETQSWDEVQDLTPKPTTDPTDLKTDN